MRQDLRAAFDNCVKLFGTDMAADCVHKIIGDYFVNRVPDDKVDDVINELRTKRPIDSIHASLAKLGEKIYGHKR